MPQQLRRTIRMRRLFSPGDRVLVAVSGGADSVALLVALRDAATKLKVRVDAAHFHHRLRGADADADAEFCRRLCQSLDLPFHLGQAECDLPAAGLEAAARRARYAFLEAQRQRIGAARIATGHTADDQAETVLMRLLRGSGGEGLKAIRFRRGPIVRPLLECSRAEVLDFLAGCAQDFRFDASNDDRHFLRNRVRHEVLPVLEAINPRVRQALARTAEIAQDETDLLERAARRLLATDGVADAVGLSIERLMRQAAPIQARVVRRWLGRGRSLSRAEIDAVLAVARTRDGAAAVDLADGRRVRRKAGRLSVAETPARK